MFHGSIVALVTPMDERGRVDLDALLRLLDFQLRGGTSAVVIAGTTGESSTLTSDEFEILLARTIAHVDRRMGVIAGTGSADTRTAIARTQSAERLGADAALLVTPYYSRPSQAGLKAHFEAIAGASGLPLIPYNVPSRTAVDLLPETLAALQPPARFVAVKEALRDSHRVAGLLGLVGARMAVLSGDDPSCLESLQMGCAGVISVAANIVPRPMSELCAAVRAGDLELATRINGQLAGLFAQLAVETNPIPVKWAAYRMGLIKPGIRLPLLPLDPGLRPGLESSLEKLGLTPVTEKTSAC